MVIRYFVVCCFVYILTKALFGFGSWLTDWLIWQTVTAILWRTRRQFDQKGRYCFSFFVRRWMGLGLWAATFVAASRCHAHWSVAEMMWPGEMRGNAGIRARGLWFWRCMLGLFWSVNGWSKWSFFFAWTCGVEQLWNIILRILLCRVACVCEKVFTPYLLRVCVEYITIMMAVVE